MNALKVTNVSKTYKSRRGEIRALDGVSFAVPERGIFGLLGMNGAGKSTAVKICTGTAFADDGVVEVFGRDIARERAAVLAHGKIVADGAPAALIEQAGASDFEDAFIKLSGGDCG